MWGIFMLLDFWIRSGLQEWGNRMSLVCREVKTLRKDTRQSKKKQHKHYLGAHDAKVANALSNVHPASRIFYLQARRFAMSVMMEEYENAACKDLEGKARENHLKTTSDLMWPTLFIISPH